MGLIYGVGIYERGKFSGYIHSKHTKEYAIWKRMLERCYCAKTQVKHPTYIGCSVSDNFKNFQYFAEWCQSQIGFGVKGYELDKDFISKGNKLYSEDTCFFIPQVVNVFIIKADRRRGKYPVGVSIDKKTGRFIARCRDGSEKKNSKYLGVYKTSEEAFQAYKTYKEALAKELAIKYERLVHPKVIEVLSNFTVNIEE